MEGRGVSVVQLSEMRTFEYYFQCQWCEFQCATFNEIMGHALRHKEESDE